MECSHFPRMIDIPLVCMNCRLSMLLIDNEPFENEMTIFDKAQRSRKWADAIDCIISTGKILASIYNTSDKPMWYLVVNSNVMTISSHLS